MQLVGWLHDELDPFFASLLALLVEFAELAREVAVEVAVEAAVEAAVKPAVQIEVEPAVELGAWLSHELTLLSELTIVGRHSGPLTVEPELLPPKLENLSKTMLKLPAGWQPQSEDPTLLPRPSSQAWKEWTCPSKETSQLILSGLCPHSPSEFPFVGSAQCQAAELIPNGLYLHWHPQSPFAERRALEPPPSELYPH